MRIRFEAGVYHLKEASVADRSGRLAMVHLWGHDNWAVEGAADAAGDPATTLQMNLALRNEVTGARHLDIRDCNGFEARNLVIDQNPRMATAARVLQVDPASGVVTIEVLEGMPHFDGMASFSANNWDLGTGLLIEGPPVTIGTNPAAFGNWSAVPGIERRYTITSPSIAGLVKAGEGLSFHFNVEVPQGRSIDAYRCKDVVFENILVHNALGMVMGAGDNENMTFRRFHVRPEGNSLAVGPRDGIHMSRCDGRLLMEDVLVRGVRWDPLVSYKYHAPIAERISDRSIRLDSADSRASLVLEVIGVGSEIHFWTGSNPTVGVVSGVLGEVIECEQALDPSAQAGGIITPGEWHWDQAIIRNSTIESNYGTALVYEDDNLLVENCIFRNNSYSNIGLGATSSAAGLFTRNIVIRNNLFEGSTWQPKYSGSYLGQHRGTITLFNRCPDFTTEPYHRNIVIEDNLFRDLAGVNAPAAVDVKLAEEVTIRNNRYENVASDILVDGATTANVTISGLGIGRNLGPTHYIESIPGNLDGLQMVRFDRGANAPVPPFEFSVDRPVTVYLAVHDRGSPTIPPHWVSQPGKVKWRTSATSLLTDTIYRADFGAGQVGIPGHDGSAGSFFGVPHLLLVGAQDGGDLTLSPATFTSPTAPDIRKADLQLYWSGDSMTPFQWALEAGFADGRELSMFQGYLLNRRNMDLPFRIGELQLLGATMVSLSWPSDGLPNGNTVVRATTDLAAPVSTWSVLEGCLAFDGGKTRFTGSNRPDGGKAFFQVEVGDEPGNCLSAPRAGAH